VFSPFLFVIKLLNTYISIKLMSDISYIFGRNPVLEALRSQRTIQKIYIQHGTHGANLNKIFRLAKRNRIPTVPAESKKLIKLVGDVSHQGVIALLSPVDLIHFDELLQKSEDINEIQLLIILDGIQDPHNVGAIIRSAEAFGARGILLSIKGTCPITDTVVKSSAGAVMHIPISREKNLSQSIIKLKERNYWIYGSSLKAEKTLWEMDFNRKCAIIIGNEEHGIRPVLQNACDDLFKIKQPGKTASLNASVAAGVILAESVRQRQKISSTNL
jgi:23S rRNA (guanosine2251-2'-O)-methyltransferase